MSMAAWDIQLPSNGSRLARISSRLALKNGGFCELSIGLEVCPLLAWAGECEYPRVNGDNRVFRMLKCLESATLPGFCREMHRKSKLDRTLDVRQTGVAGRFGRRVTSGVDAVCRR